MAQGDQFLRKINLTLSNASGAGLDLSLMRIKFQTQQDDAETPNIVRIRVYNLSDATVKKAINEFDTVSLSAGYETGNFGIIFSGTIKQFRRGRERNVDSYLDVFAADGDGAYNFGVINTTLAAGATPQQVLQACANAMNLPLDQNAIPVLQSTGALAPEIGGKVMMGMARSFLYDMANTHGFHWSIQNGALTLVPLSGYLPGTAVAINSQTGMIGVPEATNDGIHIDCLLNANIKVGYAVKINNKDVNTATSILGGSFPSLRSGPVFVAGEDADGLYRVIVVEHEGDTRGTEWYSHLVCLSINDPLANTTFTGKVSSFG